MQCADAQGVFYYNSQTNQSSATPPPQFAGQAQPAPAQAAPQAQHVTHAAPAPAAKLKSTIGDWQICEDAQGEFYVHAPTGQTFNEAPLDLLRLVQAAQKPAVPQQYAAPPAVAPPAAAPAPQAKLKMTLGDWQICEDAQGEFYVHAPTGQTFDQPPPQLVQLYQATQKPSASASQYASAAPPQYAAASQQYATASPQQYTAAPQQYGVASAAPTSQHYATTAPQYGAAQYAQQYR